MLFWRRILGLALLRYVLGVDPPTSEPSGQPTSAPSYPLTSSLCHDPSDFQPENVFETCINGYGLTKSGCEEGFQATGSWVNSTCRDFMSELVDLTQVDLTLNGTELCMQEWEQVFTHPGTKTIKRGWRLHEKYYEAASAKCCGGNRRKAKCTGNELLCRDMSQFNALKVFETCTGSYGLDSVTCTTPVNGVQGTWRNVSCDMIMNEIQNLTLVHGLGILGEKRLCDQTYLPPSGFTDVATTLRRKYNEMAIRGCCGSSSNTRCTLDPRDLCVVRGPASAGLDWYNRPITRGDFVADIELENVTLPGRTIDDGPPWQTCSVHTSDRLALLAARGADLERPPVWTGPYPNGHPFLINAGKERIICKQLDYDVAVTFSELNKGGCCSGRYDAKGSDRCTNVGVTGPPPPPPPDPRDQISSDRIKKIPKFDIKCETGFGQRGASYDEKETWVRRCVHSNYCWRAKTDRTKIDTLRKMFTFPWSDFYEEFYVMGCGGYLGTPEFDPRYPRRTVNLPAGYEKLKTFTVHQEETVMLKGGDLEMEIEYTCHQDMCDLAASRPHASWLLTWAVIMALSAVLRV